MIGAKASRKAETFSSFKISFICPRASERVSKNAVIPPLSSSKALNSENLSMKSPKAATGPSFAPSSGPISVKYFTAAIRPSRSCPTPSVAPNNRKAPTMSPSSSRSFSKFLVESRKNVWRVPSLNPSSIEVAKFPVTNSRNARRDSDAPPGALIASPMNPKALDTFPRIVAKLSKVPFAPAKSLSRLPFSSLSRRVATHASLTRTAHFPRASVRGEAAWRSIKNPW